MLVAPVAVFVDFSVVVTVWCFGLLTMSIFGLSGGTNGATVMSAWSVAWTVAPVGGLPVAVATLVNAPLTFGLVQV